MGQGTIFDARRALIGQYGNHALQKYLIRDPIGGAVASLEVG